MFVREKKNKSGSVSIQIIKKEKGNYKSVKTIGCGAERQEIEQLKIQGQQEIIFLKKQISLFASSNDELVESAINGLNNSSIRTVGPELIFGRIYDAIGFDRIGEQLFRHLVIFRLAFPLSKLKTSEYLYRYQGASIDVNKIYRFLDKLNDDLKEQVQQIAYTHAKKTLGGNIDVVFYDMTTLYFEAADEDDLRKTGFSKDGKHSNPQIFIGLLVGLEGYAIGYDIFVGNTYEGHTLIPFLKKIQAKFDLDKPVVIADSGLLSHDNLIALEKEGYHYILGARIKNEDKATQEMITQWQYQDGEFNTIEKKVHLKENGQTEIRNRRLLVHYSSQRAKKDAYNREKGIKRLEKRIKSGKLTKANINNRGYNKYLDMEGEVNIKIDYEKYEADSVWDGLKGYITNSKLSAEEILENYSNLWHIEKAFRMSKTDLRIRPIYHRLQKRIEAHICIAFTAYTVYKELEKALKESLSSLSLQKASEITHNMYQITYQLPDSKYTKTKILNMDESQTELYEIIQKKYRVSQ